MTEKAKKWLDTISDKKTAMEVDLLKRAIENLESNIYSSGDYPWSPYICISPAKGCYDGIWNWDSAFHAVGLSYWDVELAKDSILGYIQFQRDSGIYPDVIWETGDVVDEFTKPPVFPWAAKIIYEHDGDIEFIKKVYPSFVKNEEFWTKKRNNGGLFFYYTEDDKSEMHHKNAKLESGWDDSVRWDNSAADLWTIDLNCFMVTFYHSMKFFAKILGYEEDLVLWKEKEEKLSRLINEKLWDDKQKSYVDVNRFTGAASTVLSPASFMPLFTEIAPVDKAEYMNALAADDNKFHSGMPTVAYDNPEYSKTFWRGPTWLNTAYFAAKGLKNYGFETADEIKNTVLAWVDKEKTGIFENYDSKTGDGLCAPNFSWSSVFVIEFICEF